MAFSKVSVDEAAKKYWETLYGEYGKSLVRDIPRRIKAALAANKKIASADVEADVHPIASARNGDGLIVEGMYTDADSKLLFRASIASTGDVEDIQAIEIK